MNDNAVSIARPANDNAVPPLRLVRVCPACVAREALPDGYCGECAADANAEIDARRAWSDWQGDR